MPAFVAADFFVLRAPLLPFRTLAMLSSGMDEYGTQTEGPRAIEADRVRVLRSIKELLANPIVREAIFVASPSLDDAIDVWLRAPDQRADRVAATVLRYLTRMSARATPFGLFSGCAVGRVGYRTQLTLAERQAVHRHTRLDTHFLAQLTLALESTPTVRQALRYRPNDSLSATAGQVRYAEVRSDTLTRARSYHLVSIEQTPAIEAVLTHASKEGGATPEGLTLHVLEHHPGIDPLAASDFIDSLISSQLLVSDLATAVTGDGALRALLAVLSPVVAAETVTVALREVERDMLQLDRRGLGVASGHYRDLLDSLKRTGVEPDVSRLFQVDLHLPGPDLTLGGRPLREIERAIELIAKITPTVENEALDRFREAFAERYGEHAVVPLLEVLDDEAGIGFGEVTDPSPLLDELHLTRTPTLRHSFGTRESCLLRGLQETARSGAIEWRLSDADLLEIDTKSAPPLPNAFAVVTSIAAVSEAALAEGDFTLVTPRLSGPSGAALLGRFCHGDATLREGVERHLRAEEALQPAAAFAEIAHLPEGRTGNVLCRPVLREFEIPLLGGSGAPRNRQLPLSDLFIFLSDGRIVLWSQRLGREVVPRLTSAHNYAKESLGAYRFLSSLQSQQTQRFWGWNWAPLDRAPFLPRVAHGRVILSLAEWNLSKSEIAIIAAASGDARYEVVAKLQARRGLPRWVALADDDQVLPLDLLNPVAVDSFVQLVKERESVRLQEVYPSETSLIATNSEGRYVHELVLPFVRALGLEKTQAASPRRGAPRLMRVQSARSPGSDWLYAKLYTGTAGADEALRRVVAPLLEVGRQSDDLKGWFFIRYADPHWHLRVRFRGRPAWLTSFMIPELNRLAAPLLEGRRIWRLELGTYERETDRYGGPDAIALAEELFQADSDAVLSILKRVEHGSADSRWKLTIRGGFLLLDDLQLGREMRLQLLRRMRALLAARQEVNKRIEVDMRRMLRRERPALQASLARLLGDEDPLELASDPFAERSRTVKRVVTKLRSLEENGRLHVPIDELAGHFLHLHCNRMLRADHGMHELVLYDWLIQLEESAAARAQ